jgi:hypothetical protein
MLARTFDAASTVTDWRFNDMTENCTMLVGYHITINPEFSWPDPWNRINPNTGERMNISGITDCISRVIEVGTPKNNDWRYSSIVHELFHAIQKCDAPLPSDRPEDDMHANWVRDNIYQSIDRVNTLP